MKVFVIILLIGQLASAKVAFQKQTDTQRLITVAEDDGSQQTVISNPELDTYHPDISSSGRYVAYSRGKIRAGEEVNVEVVVRDLETGLVEIWTEKGNQYIHVEFSGNDRFLAYSGLNKNNNKQNIHLIDLEQERLNAPFEVSIVNGELTYKYSPKKEIIKSEYDCYAPALSSDASFIIYHRTMDKTDKSSAKQLVMFNRGTKELTQITDENKHAMFPSLSADERLVTYVSKDNGQWDIYLYDLWSNTKRSLTNDENIEFTPVFAPDDSIYYTRFKVNEKNQNQIDIFKIEKEQVKNTKLKVEPKPFLNDPKVAEYVPSFSNPNEISISSLADLLSPERSSFGAVIHSNRIYIAGGHKGAGHSYPKESFLNNLEVYNLDTKEWRSLAPMQNSKHGFQMVGHKNYLYVFGGFAFSEEHLPKWKSLDEIERYDISTDTWTTLSVKLPIRRSSNAIAKIGNLVYLLGGWDSTPKFENDKDGKFLKAIDVFDLTNETSYRTDLEVPTPLRRALTSVVVGEEIHLLGGIGEGSSHFEWIDNVSVLNPKSKEWRELPPLPFATFGPGVGQVDGDLYLIGGMVLKNETTYDLNYVDDVYKFDQTAQTWTHTGVFLDKNKGFPQVLPMPGNSLGVLGGHSFEYDSEGRINDSPINSFELIEF